MSKEMDCTVLQTKRRFPARVIYNFSKVRDGNEVDCIESACPVYNLCTRKGNVIEVYASFSRALAKFKPKEEEYLLEKIQEFE